MNTATPTIQTHTSLTLFASSGEPLTVKVVSLNLVENEDIVNECRLSFQVPFELYQCISADTLFHTKPELLSPTSNGELQPDVPIQVTVTLQPQLLSSLPQQTTESDTIIDHLAKLSQPIKDIISEHSYTKNGNESAAEASTTPSPLIQTESWFGLYIKQQQPSAEVTYRTFWSYLSPSLLAKEVSSNGQISATVGHLFQDLIKQDETTTSAALSEAFDDLLQGLDSWVDDQLSSAEATFTHLADEISQAFDGWLNSDSTTENFPSPSKQPIYRAMLTFFSDDDWTFTKLKGESTLQLAFQNEHGQWTCYAIARDQQSQFIFYSVYPTIIPDHQRPTITEYLTRANHGLVQGNFEFDLDNGEIRYKTSLDITHLSINPKAIQQLVYTNVTIMGHYLPGILSILEQDISATEAMKHLEK